MKFDMKGLENGLDKLENKMDIAVRLYADTAAIKLQNYAQNNAKWTDRSGRARQSLKGYRETLQKGYRINIAHGVDYGIWLELAHEKRYAIIPETINQCSGDIMQGLDNLMGRLGKL